MHPQPEPQHFVGTQSMMHTSAQRYNEMVLNREAAMAEYTRDVRYILNDLNAEAQSRVVDYVRASEYELNQRQEQILETVSEGMRTVIENQDATRRATTELAVEKHAINNTAPEKPANLHAPDPW